MKQTADIKLRKPSRNEKAVLLNQDIHIQTSENTTFTSRLTGFVPKADVNKPMPKIALTVSVGHENIRVVADDVEELWKYFATICQTIERWSPSLSLGAEIERSSYVKQINAKNEAISKPKTPIIDIKTA